MAIDEFAYQALKQRRSMLEEFEMNSSAIQRRRLLGGLLACAGLSVIDASAQSFPSQTIRILVGLTAGGVTDVSARIVAQRMSEQLGQPVVVENRPGASGVLAAQAVSKAPANGYTLLMLPTSGAALSGVRSDLPYDLEHDFTPISMVLRGPLVLAVKRSSPVSSVKELIALAKSQPGKINLAHDGVGGIVHLAGALFNAMADVDLFFVPYKGGADSAVALGSGVIDAALLSFTSALPLIQSNKIRAIAVTTKTRSPLMPALPTVDESGVPDYESYIWIGLLAPAGIPKDVVAQLNTAVRNGLNTDEAKKTMSVQGMEPSASTPEQFAAVIRNEIERSARLSKLIGIKRD